MKIGVPKEIKANENRVALVPAGAEALIHAGHTVYVERGAGEGSGFPDEAYTAVGAQVLDTAAEVWEQAEMILKVKEPLESEWPLMRDGQIIFTFFHFAASEEEIPALRAAAGSAFALMRSASDGVSTVPGQIALQRMPSAT